MERLLRIDRRIIFVFVALGVAVPLLTGLHFPVQIKDESRNAYAQVEAIADQVEEPVMVLCFSYGASTAPEMQPMAKAILRHAFSRGIKVIVMCLWPEGPGLAQEALDIAAAEHGAEYGQDYAFMGYKPGSYSVILNMGQDFHDTFPLDAWGARTDTLAVTRDIRSLGDFDVVVDLAAGDSIEYWWIPYGQERFGFPFVAGCTAVMAPDLFPFLNSGQLKGLLGGLAGAAEYEKLIGKPEAAMAGMGAQSATHVIIVAFVVFGNVAYFLARRRAGRGDPSQRGTT